MKAKSIERIAEELGVNFFVLHPLIAARDEFMKQEGIKEMVGFGNTLIAQAEFLSRRASKGQRVATMHIIKQWQAKLREWGISEHN